MSKNSGNSCYYGIRPVVEIPLDGLTLNTWDYTGDTADDAYTLVEKTDDNKVTTGTLASSDQVEFSEVTWESNLANVTLTSTNSDLYIQYQISTDGTYSDDDWETSANKGTVDLTNIAVNSTIYMRLYDGYNYGGYGSLNVIDYVGPTVTITTSDILATSVTVTVNSAEDYQSGMPTTPTYIYQYRKEGSTTWYTAEETTSTSSTITGLDADTSYVIRVRVADNAGTYGAGVISGYTDTLVGYYVAYTPDSDTYSLVTNSGTYTGTTLNDTDFTTDTTLGWQIWSIDDDTLTLIADTTQQTGGYFSSTYGYCLYLDDSLGYANGVYLLDDICKTCYSSSSVNGTGVTATARCLDIEDLEDVLDWSVWKPTDYYVTLSNNNYYTYDMNTTYQYANTNYTHYPILWAEEDFSNIDGKSINASYTYDEETNTHTYSGDGIRRSDKTTLRTTTATNASSSINVTNTSWYATAGTLAFTDYKYEYLVFNGNSYWLSSRFVFWSSRLGYACFGLQRVDADSGITDSTLYMSSDLDHSGANGVRPVVEIPLTSLSLDTLAYTGTSTDPFELVEN